MEDGFFSRMREKINEGPGRFVMIAVTIVVIVGAILWWFVRDKKPSEMKTIEGRGVTVLFLCKACGESGQTHVGYREESGFACPKCKKHEAVTAYRCDQCKKLIEYRKESEWKCPNCHKVYHYVPVQ